MKPSLFPVIEPRIEADWVNSELIRRLMHTAFTSRFWGVLPIPILVSVLFGHVDDLALAAWTLLAVGVAGTRLRILRIYRLQIMGRSSAEQAAFYARFSLIWSAGAVVWGLTPALYVGRAPLTQQFICWLVIAGFGMLAINTFSAHLRSMRIFISLLIAVPLLILLWHIAVVHGFEGPPDHYWFVALLLVFWQVLLSAGYRVHVTHRKNFELQFRNMNLIESLTRQTQAALDAVEIKNRFLASATHDLRQPVHALALYADWLGSEPELVKEIAPKIVEATKAVNALFDSLFDFARLDSGQIKLDIEPVDLRKLLHDLEVQYRPLAIAKGLEFRVHAIQGTVCSDAILLQRIVGNLISNAIKYTLRGGVLVAVRTSADGVLRVEVWDTGIGIAVQHQRNIFREFYKVPTHAGTEDGFGLGLYIVSRLAQILGHPVSLRSRAGHGTVFRLRLQPTDKQEASERARASMAQLANMP